MTELEANQREVCTRILPCAEMAKNGVEANFVDSGEETFLESVNNVLFAPRLSNMSIYKATLQKLPKTPEKFGQN